ncbi:MAG: 23S rRNA (adenine(2503)-C(2))-methyltransferase RlmN [Proteobacteria bacterium]|nr:23S rRNA (adenine(2503)-C(2))-methyltransferase RlmN [Pseudomonadota bacterium]
MEDIRNFSFEELVEKFKKLGHQEFRVRQLFKWLYDKCCTDFSLMTDISKQFRIFLSENYEINRLEVVDTLQSEDGTIKFLFKTQFGDYVESVLIPIDGRITACLSSQIGCAMGCVFCNTGDRGFERNLDTWEILAQLIEMVIFSNQKPSNIVFMGMGEPLANYNNVVKAIKILENKYGFGYSPRKITLSTSGYADKIEQLGKDVSVKLAVSLNAVTDSVRDKIMPINKKYPLKTLMASLKKYPLMKDEEITIAYVLIEGLNDSPEDAKKLVELLKGLTVKVNLIAYNCWGDRDFKTPSMAKILAFQKVLKEQGIMTFIRDSKGADIMAACGQLRGEYEKKVS